MTPQETIIQQLDMVFKGRSKSPSKCIFFDKSSEFYIEDDAIKGYCILLKDPSEEEKMRLVKIENSANFNIALWAVDGLFFSKGKGVSRCDAIFFDDKDFCFAELKLNATSLNPISITENREKAIKQLESMIVLIDTEFSKNNYTFLEYNKEAFLCTPTIYPSKNTAIESEQIRFLETFGVLLQEKNIKSF